MDAMALLCMLHADGPSTLKSLRQAGCSSLESIETLGEERLSVLLGGPPAAARRFAREARHLRERLGPDSPGTGLLDREESVLETLPPPIEAALDPQPAMREPVARDFVEIDGGEVEAAAVETSAASDPFDEALETWRTLDHEDTETPEAGAPPAEPRARPEFEFGSELATAIRELAGTAVESGANAPSTPSIDGTRLVPGGLDGLDTELCLELAAAGLETVEALADSDPLHLSETLGIAYGKLWRLGCIARRAIAAPAPESAPVLQAVSASELGTPLLEKLSPSERPWRPAPSILELEWNRELRPQAPPPGHTMPGVLASDVVAERAREAEGAGGPFV